MSSPTFSYTTLVSIAFRFMSGWLLWLGLQVSLLTYLSHHQLNEAVIASLFSVLVYWISAMLCWLGAGKLARWIVGRVPSTTPPLNTALTLFDGVTLVLLLCGLLLITQDGLQDSGTFLTQILLIVHSGQTALLLNLSTMLPGVMALLKLSLGGILVCYARPLARYMFSHLQAN